MDVNILVLAMVLGALFLLRPRFMVGMCSMVLRCIASLIVDVLALLVAWM